MSISQKTVSYQRKQDKGLLVLRGSVDIFEATLLYEAAQRAARDLKAISVSVDFAGAERLDVSAAQILLALRREVEATGRLFFVAESPSPATEKLASIGIFLQPEQPLRVGEKALPS